MSRARLDTGARGEDIAAEYLISLGYEIIHRNLHLSRFEIDLVCHDGNCLVFVEVKHSRSEKYGHPATWIDSRKQDKLRQAAALYLENCESVDMDIRFDAVTIYKGQVEYFKNAF